MGALRACLVMGTRSEAVHLAPLLQASRRRRDVEFCICSTGEQPEFLGPVIDYFRIGVDLELNLSASCSSPEDPLSRAVAKFDEVLARHQPDCVVGQGSSHSTRAAALAAGERRIPFVHLRSETSLQRFAARGLATRQLRAGPAATMNCVPTRQALQHLCAAGVPRHAIHLTGFTAVDSLQWSLERERQRADLWECKHSRLGERRMLLVVPTRCGEDSSLAETGSALQTLARQFPDVSFMVLSPCHPAAQQAVRQHLTPQENVHLLEQAFYPEYVWLLDRCTWVLSDSETVVAEAMSLQKPVLFLQDSADSPEWASGELLTAVGTSAREVVAAALNRMNPPATSTLPLRRRVPGAGFDGRAAERIVDLMAARAWNEPMTVRRAA